MATSFALCAIPGAKERLKFHIRVWPAIPSGTWERPSSRSLPVRVSIDRGERVTRMSGHNADAPDIAGLVRGAAEGDRQAWERLVDQYARLIWSITADFKLIESDAADVAQTGRASCRERV